MGASYTVLPGDAWIGQKVGLSIPNNNSNYPEVDNFRLNVASVPEPASTVLLGFGLVGLLTRRRRTA